MHIVGDYYTNDEINKETGCSISGGIRIAKRTDSIVLIHVPGSVYNDRLDPNDPTVFLYTGQGLNGDQVLTRNNLTLDRSVNTPLHLYVYEGVKKFRYAGVYKKAREKFEEMQLDEEGKERKVYVFPITKA